LKLLIDTHLFLWGIEGDPRLSPAARRLIESPDNDSLVSVASLWEIAIKMRTGKLSAPDNLPDWIASNPDFELLDVTADHVWGVRNLPLHHTDPFDRLLVVQATAEELTLLTHDHRMAAYGASLILV
jgi:PIN domain nuclease of toxin-antitoxin system